MSPKSTGLPEKSHMTMIARHPVDQSRKEEDMPDHVNKDRKRRVRTTCLMLSLFLLLLMIGGGVLGFAYVNTTLLTPVTKFMRPVSRGKDEPVLNGDTSSVTGHTWNILLLGSDNDSKFNFPALLTQVMMIVRHYQPQRSRLLSAPLRGDARSTRWCDVCTAVLWSFSTAPLPAHPAPW